MREYMDGTTSFVGFFEVRLGREKFGGENHAYSVAYGDNEIEEVIGHADKIIFNSIGQLDRFGPDKASGIARGLRLDPGMSSSSFDLADPARPFSRLGEWDASRIETAMERISGFMIHDDCENRDFGLFDRMLEIEEKFGALLSRADYGKLSAAAFTSPAFRVDAFCERLKTFSGRHGIQVYLEPGEAAITRSTTLETTVLDTLNNGKDLAIVDSSIEAHMLDLLIYRESAKVEPNAGPHSIMICGKSCLAGRYLRRVPLSRAVEGRRPRLVPGCGRLHHGQEELVQRRRHAFDRHPRS